MSVGHARKFGGAAAVADTRGVRPPIVVLLALSAVLFAGEVAAQTAGPEPVEVYSVLNADEFRGFFVVAYPTVCDPTTRLAFGTAGAPAGPAPGAVSDYQVVRAGLELPTPTTCKGSELFVVEREGFTVGESGVPELDALAAEARAQLFGADPRVHTTGHRFGARTPGRPGLRKIHDVLRIERDDEFAAIGERVVYAYDDGTEEVLPFIAGRRPPPTGRSSQPETGRRVTLSSDIPRWPFIAAAAALFLGMALYGLRRRS